MTVATETQSQKRKQKKPKPLAAKGERRAILRLQAQQMEMRQQIAELSRQVEALARVAPMPEPVRFDEELWAAFDAEVQKYRELADA